MKRMTAALWLLVSAFTLHAGGTREASASAPVADAKPADFADMAPVRVIVPTGFPGIVMSSIARREAAVPGERKIEYTVLKSPDLLASRLISGEADMAIVPTNLAATLHNKTGKFVLVAPVVWGILYGVSTEPIASLDALRGKEIWSLGRGLTPDITFRHILRQGGLDPDSDVTIHYVQDATELAPAFLTGKAKMAILPEPVLSQILKKKPDTHIFLDVQKEWSRITGSPQAYPQASLVVSRDFLQSHPAWCRGFFDALKNGIESLKADPVSAGREAFAFMGEPAADIIAQSIPRANIRWVDARDAREALDQYFTVLLEADPKTIGGTIPDDSFYPVRQ